MFSLILRTLISYIIVILAVRLMGKKQLSELQPSELVTTIIISNIVTLSLEESNIPFMASVVPIVMIVCFDLIVTGINLKSNIFRKVTAGTPSIIISNGIINQSELHNLRYTIDDIMESMREATIFDISQVQYAIVENTGKISFFQKPAEQSPETASEPCDPQVVVIKDRKLEKDGLAQSGQTENWLNMLLNEKRVAVSDVFLLTADKNGTYNLILKDKKTS